MHISLTGLKPKGLFGFFKFWSLAIPSFQEAKKAGFKASKVYEMDDHYLAELILM